MRFIAGWLIAGLASVVAGERLLIAVTAISPFPGGEGLVCMVGKGYTAAHQIFCKIHYVGEPPINDCLEDFIRSKKNVRNEQVFKKSEKQRWLQSESKEQPEEIQKEKKEIRLKNLQKLEAYQKELKLKQWQKRKENHL